MPIKIYKQRSIRKDLQTTVTGMRYPKRPSLPLSFITLSKRSPSFCFDFVFYFLCRKYSYVFAAQKNNQFFNIFIAQKIRTMAIGRYDYGNIVMFANIYQTIGRIPEIVTSDSVCVDLDQHSLRRRI